MSATGMTGAKADRLIYLVGLQRHQKIVACEFRFNPAGDSDLMPATIPI